MLFSRHRPEVGRAERQVRRQARGLALVGSILLLACMLMTGIFGWSMGRTFVNAMIFAVGLAAADLAGAYFFSTAGTCNGAGEKTGGRWAFVTAMICFCVTLSGVIGFLADNRESVTKAREKAASVAEGHIQWAQRAVTKANDGDDRPKSKAQLLSQAEIVTSGIKEVGQQVQRYTEQLQSGQIAGAADGQATILARILHVSEETARSWAIGLTATALLIIQYACWYFQGFLRQRVEPAVVARAIATSPLARKLTKLTGANLGNLNEWVGYSEAHAREYLTYVLGKGFDPAGYGAITKMGRDLGWRPQRVRDFLSRQSDVKLPPPRKRTPRRSVHNGDSVMSIVATPNGKVHAS